MEDADLESAEYSWLSVLSGQPIARPVKTNYGWVCVTDGKMASAFTEDGAVLWQRGLPSAPLPLVSCDKNDFTYVLLKNRRLCLLNPSGVVLWQSPLGFEPAFPAIPGFDGRAFVFGPEGGACFGANGIKKWAMKFEKQERLSKDIPPCPLLDGSILAFLFAEQDGKTVALRISPFGVVMERIVFSGRVMGAFPLSDGCLLAFFDGSLGLCSVGEDGLSLSKWVLKGLFLKEGLQCAEGALGKACVATAFNSGTRVFIIDVKKGRVESSLFIEEISRPKGLTPFADGFFLEGETCGSVFSFEGRLLRKVKFPQKSKSKNWLYAAFGKNGTLAFIQKNWSVSGYKVFKTGGAKKSFTKKKTYEDFYEEIGKDFSRIKEAPKTFRREELKAGGYGDRERIFVKDAALIMEDYFLQKGSQNSLGGAIGALSDEGFYSFSISEQAAVISMLGLFGTAGMQEKIARVLAVETDETVLIQALKAAQECGYDPDGKILQALELLVKNARGNQTALLLECMDSLYSVCRFMGRAAVQKRGLSILSRLTLPQYADATKEKARKTYEKLAELKL